MKRRIAIPVLVLIAAALTAANWHAYRAQPAPLVQAGSGMPPLQAAVAPAAVTITNTQTPPPPVILEEFHGNETSTAAPAAVTSRSASIPAVRWIGVESTDYKQYVANLRALGFPEELIRPMIIADVSKLYAERETALADAPQSYDTASSRNAKRPYEEELQRIQQLRQVRIEKQDALKEILGTYVPRELLKSPGSARNYEAHEYAISMLPEEKRDRVQLIAEDTFMALDTGQAQSGGGRQWLPTYKQICASRDDALHEVLTRDEFHKYEMSTTPTGTELARNVAGMNPTDEEMINMYQLAKKNWVDTGGIYGKYRADPVPPDQIAAADEAFNTAMKESLGSDRFLDYRMATSDVGQQLRNLGIRYNVPKEVLSKIFDLQMQADYSGAISPRAGSLPGVTIDSPSEETPASLQQKISELLGPTLWAAWQDGRDRRPKLDP